MTYKEVQGDLFSTEDRYILHGCNCLGVMGAGVALMLRRLYPVAYEAYEAYCERWPTEDLLGTFLVVDIHENRSIINAMTQRVPGNGKQVSYDAIDRITKDLNQTLPGESISMPKIGAGLAGGDWEIISTIIKQNMPDVNVTVWVYDA